MDIFIEICYLSKQFVNNCGNGVLKDFMNSQDIRIVKTKKNIRDALFQLLETKPINKISISELSAAACINRKTFYAHYNSIEDVIAEIEDEIVVNIDEYLKECIIGEYGLNPYYFVQFINSLYTTNPEFYENIVSIRNYHFIVEKLKSLFKKQVILSLENIPDEKKFMINLQLEFIISGVAAIYIEWIKEGKPCPFEDISIMIYKLVIDGPCKYSELFS